MINFIQNQRLIKFSLVAVISIAHFSPHKLVSYVSWFFVEVMSVLCKLLVEAKLANFVFLSIPQFHQINTRLMSTINSQKQMSYFHERMNIITQTNIIKICLKNGICKIVFFAFRFTESPICPLRGSYISILSISQKNVHIIETLKI